jgi:SAM-dependent methyltransferase
LLRSDPVFDLDLEKLYRESAFDYQSEITGLKKTYLNIVARNLPAEKMQGSIYEIGCGNGFFLEAAKDAGFNVIVGVEPSNEAISKARSDIRKNLIPSMMKSSLLEINKFDIGVMFHTMDHLADPVSTLTACFQSLKKDGIFIAAVHNEKSWSARLLKAKSPIIDVEHTYLFNKKTAEKLFEKVGFVNIKSRSYMNCYSLAYIIHLIPIPLSIRKKILSGIIGKLLLKIKVTLPLGNLWVSGIKQ